jgi:galactokinase
LNQTKRNEYSARGRVNLIGEQTDYTGGLVMPMGIPFSTYADVSSAEDGSYHFVSDMFPDDERVIAPNHRSAKTGNWSDYPLGVLYELQELGVELPPFTLRVRGNVPLGAGLSSSASLEVATAVALLALTGTKLSLPEIPLLCQRAENRYVGFPYGIMDQFASAAAVKGHALLLHTRNSEVRVVAPQPRRPCGLPRCHPEQRDQALHLLRWRLRITQARRGRRPEHCACPVRR